MLHKLTKHHIVPRHLNWSNHWNNILKLKDNVHKALHLLLDDEQSRAQKPREQFIKLIWMYDMALTDQFKNDVYKILLEVDDAYYYKNWILIPKE